MGSNISFTLDRSGGAEILRNNTALQSMQKTAMDAVLINVTAQFFQTFGAEGRFEIVEFTTDRSSIKINAANAQTAAILKSAPKWLDTFINNITI
jgi:hypothetical protein